MPRHPSFRTVVALLALIFATSTFAQPTGGSERRAPATRPTRPPAAGDRAIGGGPASRPTRAPTVRDRAIGKLPRYLNGLAGTALASAQPTPDARDYSPKDNVSSARLSGPNAPAAPAQGGRFKRLNEEHSVFARSQALRHSPHR